MLCVSIDLLLSLIVETQQRLACIGQLPKPDQEVTKADLLCHSILVFIVTCDFSSRAYAPPRV
jgi:hypothetical protein